MVRVPLFELGRVGEKAERHLQRCFAHCGAVARKYVAVGSAVAAAPGHAKNY
jgi:hypothetical protein